MSLQGIAEPSASARPLKQGRDQADRRAPDAESLGWVRALSGTGPEHEEAVERLHALLLRAARFEVNRRRAAIGADSGNPDDLAMQAANDALVAVMSKLHTFRGDSRFTTWAYKFALLEAGVKARRRAWEGRELPLEEEGWARIADPGPAGPSSLSMVRRGSSVIAPPTRPAASRERRGWSCRALRACCPVARPGRRSARRPPPPQAARAAGGG